MPLSPTPAPSSPSDSVRSALMDALLHAHRPELADIVALADLTLDFPGVWLRPRDPSLSSTWLAAKLWSAALEEGVPVSWIQVVRGGEA